MFLLISFIVLMIVVFGRIFFWGLRAAWGIAKFLLTIVFFPLILIGMAVSGLMGIAVIILIVGGIIAFIAAAA